MNDQTDVLLAARGLSLSYGTVPAVSQLDLEVRAGEVVALMGANGAGKSTTLMGLAGLLGPAEGHVELMGEPTTEPLHRRARRGVRYVSEERSVIRSLSTLDNLRLGPGPVDDALSLFPELEALLDRPAGLLSGGEQQIVTLARALAGDVRVLLADELSLGLAPLIVQRLLGAARDAAAQRGVGVLLVEQHAHLALKHADRAYVLHRGQIVLSGPADELSDRLDEIEASYLHGAMPAAATP
ncbi:ABC transporter ATP-binding protein [Ilumatobacter coccineus]|uniref:Putative branched-chain amino acid ABC transporter ATP-binding protein n=1 Tax=Ilumatobacter coccineus (strain NBRC 103263 / KCTC 29153 / YM16-304) TaxID=1313172 RepID=A0A6C7E0R1_ILUCY|nr:ATP-binding cassette domain-containing protein [Ilumatobacter coccineus]BAN00867.1 putative branched-chain amino acid ABC transporter ATP-binding protein [Ilumatobacter coccineus YM16-304]